MRIWIKNIRPGQLKVYTISSLVTYLVLIDTLQAVHFNRASNYSTSELFIKMPCSDHPFRTVYNSLIHGYALPSDVKSDEDALLLLIAILNDIVYMLQCHLSMPYPPSYQESNTSGLAESQIGPLRNPWAPLSLQSEFCRLGADLLAALSRWHVHFKDQVRNDILALYHFTELQLLCPDLGALYHVSGYAIQPDFASTEANNTKKLDISDKALDLAWLILEHSDISSEPAQERLSVWLPIILFSSALVVWHKLQSTSSKSRRYGTVSVLITFKNLIVNLPWPCCKPMVATLDRLMKR